MGKLKEEIRRIHIKKRKNMTFFEKEQKDREIFKKLIELEIFKKALVVLTYVSVKIEVDTIRFIEYCFKENKKVFVPVCSKIDGIMNFYFLENLNQLHFSKFSLLEPSEKKENLFKNSNLNETISIVPGISFDFFGERIGYGKGFYDRFLKNFSGFKIGICYDFNLEKKIKKDIFDIPVDMVLTEKQIIKSR